MPRPNCPNSRWNLTAHPKRVRALEIASKLSLSLPLYPDRRRRLRDTGAARVRARAPYKLILTPSQIYIYRPYASYLRFHRGARAATSTPTDTKK